MDRIATAVDGRMQKALVARLRVTSIILLVIGFVGLICFIALSVALPESATWVNVFLAFSLPFGIGLVFLLSANKTVKTANTNLCVNYYTFDESVFIVETVKNGEVTATAKIYYADLVKTKVTKEYIFLYLNKTQALPVEKTAFAPVLEARPELNEVLHLS